MEGKNKNVAIVLLGAIILGMGGFWLFSASVQAAAGINRQINFQGKVTNTDGTNVANGSYTFLFCLYTTGSPVTACTSGANNDAVWRESKSITVTDGIFQTDLGDTTTLPGSVDFNTDNIYLGINFNANGQMTPLVRFTAAPYAMNADKVHGLTVTDTTGTLTIANDKTVSFADAFTTSGAFATTLTVSGITNATLPSGTITLADIASSQTLTNKTIGSTGLVFSGASADITTATDEDLTLSAAGTGVISLNDSVSITGTSLTATSATTVTLGSIGADTITIGNGGADTITIGNAASTGVSITDDSWSISTAGAAAFASATVSGTLAANGGITFDNATDTVGAHTLSGTINANTNILENIGNTGTDFIASTGALTLAGVLTANGGISLTASQSLTGGAASFIDLASVTHGTTANQGLRLPNAASATPSNPTSGEGYLAWDVAGNQLIVYNGTTWSAVGGGSVSADSLDFTEFLDAMTLDASTDIAITGTNVFSLTNSGTGNSFVVNDQATDTTPFVIDAAGNVGIGTSTPSDMLTVYKAFNPSVKIDNGGANNLQFWLGSGGTYIAGNGDGGVTTADLIFSVGNSASSNPDRMVINATSGFVGIGDMTPDGLFDFDLTSTSTTGATEYGANFTVTDTGIVTTGTDTTYGESLSVTRTGATGGTITTYGQNISVTGSTGGTSTVYGLRVAVSGADTNYAAAFTGGGVRVGTATGDTNVPFYVVSGGSPFGNGSFGGGTVAAFQNSGSASDSARIELVSGSTGTTAITFDNSATSGRGLIDYTVANGFGFYVNGSGTANAVLNASGNLGIGDTTPDGRLDFDLASTSTTGATEYGANFTVSDTGIVTTGTDTTYGESIAVTRTGATGGTINIYGQYINLVSDDAGAGTSTAYGSYIDTNVAGTANADTVYGQYIMTEANAGTTAYGLYVDVGAGAGTEYGARFSGGKVNITSSSAMADPTISALLNLAASGSSNQLAWGATLTSSGNVYGTLGYCGSCAPTEISMEAHNADLVFSVAAAERMRIQASTGYFGIGDASPAALLTVGNGDLFQVDSTGNLIKVNNVTYSWPASQGGASTVLTNNGSGTLTWAAAGGVAADSLDFTEFLDAMTLDASTDIAITGTNVFSLTNSGTGNSFVVNDQTTDTTPFVIDAAGNVAIGASTASAKLDVTGDANAIAIRSTGYSLTGSDAQSLIDVSGTWNTTGTPTLIKANVTDTASAGSPILLDLQVNGTSAFAVSKYGSAYMYGIVDFGSAYINGGVHSQDGTYSTANSVNMSLYPNDGTGTAAMTLLSSNGNVGIGDTTPDGRLDFDLASTSTTGATEYGANFTVTDTGIVTTGTDTTYGESLSVTRTGATGGTITTYGQNISVTGSTGGTSTVYGLRVAVSGADTNYAAAFTGGNVGIGTATPNAGAMLDVSNGVSGAYLAYSNGGNYYGIVTDAPDCGGSVCIGVGAGTTSNPNANAMAAAFGVSNANGTGVYISSATVTTGRPFFLTQYASTFTGTTMLANMAAGSGSFTGAFLDFQKNSVSQFYVDDNGDTTLGLQADLRFADLDSTNWVAFQAPATVGTNVTWTLPSADSSGCLQSNGSGTLSIGSCGGISTTNWDTIGDAAASGAIAMAEYAQTMDWNTAATAAAFDGLTVTITNDATTDTLTQRAFVVANVDDSTTTGTTETIAQIVNRDSDEAVGTGLLVENTGTGTMTDAIRILETAGTITTAINIGNNVTTGISIGTGVTTGISIASGGIDATGNIIFTNTGTGLSLRVNDVAGDTTPFVIDADGNVGIGTTSPARILDIVQAASAPQLRLSKDLTNYSEMTVDSVGDLQLAATGGDIRATSENLWVCDGAACPALTLTGQGNIFVENVLKFGNGVYLKNDSSTELTVYDANDQAMLVFDQL